MPSFYQVLLRKTVLYPSLRSKTNGTWFNVDIKKVIEDWIKKPDSNYGLHLEVFDSSGNSLSITDPDDENVSLARLMCLIII